VFSLASDEMEIENSGFSRPYSILSLLIGSLYCIFAISQILEGVGLSLPITDEINIPGDLASGFVLMITALLLLTGGIYNLKGDRDGNGFIMVGFIMGLFLSSVHLLVLLSSIATTSLRGEGEIDIFFILDGLVPGLYLVIPLFLLAVPNIRTFKETRRMKTKEDVR
jgi:hypothetical protein